VRWRPATGQSAVEYALGWLADHAEDLDTDPSRLVVLGVGAAATATAATACAARDNAWPVLARHVIALPDDIPEVWASPRSLSGVCDATVILAPAAKTSPYVRALVLAGVPVRQRRLPAGSDAGLLATIVATDLADLPGPGERRPARTFTGGPLVR
jgi:hypothetical protein